MPTAARELVRSLRRDALLKEAASGTDRQLLAAFAETGDESAFNEIVRRHGPLVLGVCRRILGNIQDAEDAFQATFLVLARKAGSSCWHDSVKNWLHGVALRVATKARSQAIKRKQKEAAAGIANESHPTAYAWNELRTILDEELAHLPDKYRLVLLLCYLEGKTRDEAAEQLGWTVGSVKGCLERGREMLRARLSKRGLALSLALSVSSLAGVSAQGAVGATLMTATVQAATLYTTGSATQLAAPILTLAQGALNAMMIAKLKSFGFVTALLLFAAGTLGGAYYAAGESSAVAANTPEDHGLTAAQFVAFVQEREGQKDGRKSDEVLALVKEIDLKVGTVSVSFLRDGGGEETYSLADKNLKVTSTLGVAMKLGDLAAGQRVWLTLKDRDVAAIRIENPTVPAFINSTNPAQRTIEVRAERKISTLPVAKDAKITVNGKEVAFAEIPIEQRVYITMTFDKKAVIAIQGNRIVPGVPVRPKEGQPKEGRPRDGERPVERPNVVVGTIIEVDAGKNAIGVLSGRADELQIHTYSIGKNINAKLMFENHPIGELAVAQLTKPMQATIQFADDKTTVTGLTVLAPTTRGIVKSIDVAGKKITIVDATREEKTFDIRQDALVRLNERGQAKLNDIMPRMNVTLALTPDRQRVIGVAVHVSRRDGDQ